MKKSFLLLAVLLSVLLSSCGVPKMAEFSSDRNIWLGGYAERELVPDDPGTHKYYVAGYKNDNPATGILDCQKAKAVYLEADGSAIVFVAVDCVGLSSGDVNKIKKAADLPEGISLHVAATHTHAGIDTLGLWGPVAVDGKDAGFSRRVITEAAEAAKEAYENRTRGRLFYGSSSEGIEDLQRDSRLPEIYDRNLYQLRFEAETGQNFRIVDYAAHAESLRGDNTLISADYPRYLADAVERETGEKTLYLPGAVGGLVMTRRLTDGAGAELPAIENAIATGELLAKTALSIEGEELLPRLSCATAEIEIPLDNKVFVAMISLGVITNEVTQSRAGEYGLAVKTSVSLMRLGDVYIVCLPGEIFPELVYGCGESLGVSASVGEIIVGEFTVVGLCDDEIGYIIPPADFLLDGENPYLEGAEGHYEETNSVGPEAAEIILLAIEELYLEINRK